MVLIIPMMSSQINPDDTHFDYHQGVGRIIEKYHYLHFNLNITTLKETYNQILKSYHIIALRSELKESNLLKQAAILCEEVAQTLQQIMPHKDNRVKRGLINGLGSVIKFIFGNPDADDLTRINEYLEKIEHEQREDIVALSQSMSAINKINKDINNNTEIINKNLENITKTLNEQNKQLSIFEAVITLIIQEQHFLDLLNKIKRSFIFSEKLFNLEILTYKQISDICEHLKRIYSQKEMLLHYHNLLDFRFAQGSIVFTQDTIVYTLKFPILNPIEFFLFQRLAIINKRNETEIISTPWRLITPLIKIFANKCQFMYEENYLCSQITTGEIQKVVIPIQSPLSLTYKLSENETLISSNYLINIETDKNEKKIQGTEEIIGRNIHIQGHPIDKDMGEIKLNSLILPIIIKNYQMSFEPLKNINIPKDIIVTAPFEYHTHIYMSSIIILILLLLAALLYFIWKTKNKQFRHTQMHVKEEEKNEDVLPTGPGGVI